MKTRKILWWLFVMAVFCAVTSGGCGGGSTAYYTPPSTQSEDVTPTPTSPDVTPTPTPTPSSPDVTPTPTPTPSSPDVTPTPTPTPTSPDVTPTPAPTPTDSTAAIPSESTLNVNDTATASKVLAAVGGAGSTTRVAALPDEAVGAERSLEELDISELSAIPGNETPALALPIMRVNSAVVYVWGLDLSTLTAGDYIFMHMMPEAVSASGFSAAADSSGNGYSFLDDSGNVITRVPASKKVNAAAYMEPAYIYSPIITTSTTAAPTTSEDIEPVVPVVPVPPTSEDIAPFVPTSPDVTPEIPTSPDIQPVVPTSPDVTPVVPDTPASGDTPPDVPDTPASGDTPPDVPTPPTSGDTPPDVPTPPTSGDTTPTAPDTPASTDVTPTKSSDVTTPTVTEDVTGETYTSNTAFENALLINGATSTYTNITVTKTGDASGQSENYDWYGTNAAILAQGGANVTISGSGTTIYSKAVGGNAVFAYGGNSSMNTNNSGDGTAITISDAVITTESNNSGGIMVTGGGTIEANNLTVTTASGSSAAIRSDRGGGTITATGGSYTTNGTGSPAIYSTAAISVYDADLTSNVAQVVVIEGGNSVNLDEARLTANHTKLNGQDTSYQAILIYQSQSGDASSGSSSFTMKGGSLTNAHGDIFHVTNTTTTITLSDSIAITNNDSSGNFLDASSDSWGTSGSNGGKVTLNADGQTIDGNMLVDSVSTLAFNMSNSSIFNGAINPSGQTGSVSVVIDSSSTWTLTGNSYVTSLTNNGTINTGSYTLYVNGVAYSN